MKEGRKEGRRALKSGFCLVWCEVTSKFCNDDIDGIIHMIIFEMFPTKNQGYRTHRSTHDLLPVTHDPWPGERV